MSFTLIGHDGMKLIDITSPLFHRDYLTRLSEKLPLTLFPDNLDELYPEYNGYFVAPNCTTLFKRQPNIPAYMMRCRNYDPCPEPEKYADYLRQYGYTV
jgi:hypothetical protein